jgi:hypothetical protein
MIDNYNLEKRINKDEEVISTCKPEPIEYGYKMKHGGRYTATKKMILLK